MTYQRKEHIGNCTLYLGDCRDILPTLDRVDAVVTDPPYGVLSQSGSAATRRPSGNSGDGVQAWDVSITDDMVSMILDRGEHAMIWGGCHIALPPTFGYLIWDKVCERLNFGEVEYCWTTLRFAPRMKRVRAAGMDGGKQHPTQKPTLLMEWCLSFIPNAGSILDPFMGSGTTGVACAKMGRSFIGIEISEDYFNIACERIREAYSQPDMFVEKSVSPND